LVLLVVVEVTAPVLESFAIEAAESVSLGAEVVVVAVVFAVFAVAAAVVVVIVVAVAEEITAAVVVRV
jgi:hypothetical protein